MDPITSAFIDPDRVGGGEPASHQRFGHFPSKWQQAQLPVCAYSGSNPEKDEQ
jgi:hypothetical protein